MIKTTIFTYIKRIDWIKDVILFRRLQKYRVRNTSITKSFKRFGYGLIGIIFENFWSYSSEMVTELLSDEFWIMLNFTVDFKCLRALFRFFFTAVGKRE